MPAIERTPARGERICRQCEWWDDYGKDQDYGECQFEPPTVIVVQHPLEVVIRTDRPSTHGYMRCGRWQRKID